MPAQPPPIMNNTGNVQQEHRSSKGQCRAIPCERPSFISKSAYLGTLIAIFAIWMKYTVVSEETSIPAIHAPLHSYKIPLAFTVGYLLTLPLLKKFVAKCCADSNVDIKALLEPSMIFYNVAQVMINLWMVARFIRAILFEGHPFIGNVTSSTTTYVVWVHYTNKYLEFLDTIFMVLRGRIDQVSFLHVYHHTTITWAWWVAMRMFPRGDSYFGALLNSWIHVLMYSYYALALLKIPCPWKKYLTQAQLLQFATVMMYTYHSCRRWPEKDAEFGHYIAMFVQIWEMSSLLALFMVFYKKSYNCKSLKMKMQTSSRRKLSDGGEQKNGRHFATRTASFTKVASAVLDAASDDANRFVSTAKNVPHVKKVVKATEVPSWSIVN